LKFKLQPGIMAKPAPGAAAKPNVAQDNGTPIFLAGSSLQYQRESGVVLLHGPVTALETPPGTRKELHSAELSIELDTQMRARRMNAAGDANSPAQLQSSGPKGDQVMTADSFIADYAPAGWLQNFRAEGHVQSNVTDASGHTMLFAGTLDAKMAPELNAPAHANATGGVKIDSERTGTQRRFESTDLSVDFVNVPPKVPSGHAVSYVSHAQTPSSALLSWQELAGVQQQGRGAAAAASKGSAERPAKMVVSGKHFDMDFDEQSRLRQMLVHNTARIDRTDASGAQQTSTSDDLAAKLDETGTWSELVQNGHVKMHDADRSGQGEHSHLDRATNILVLTGAAHVSDSDSRTSADLITINQTSNELHADGHVITTYTSNSGASGSATPATYKPASAGAAPVSNPAQWQSTNPSHATSDHLVANSDTGKALYTGHARLWQTDETVDADSIELDRDTKEVHAAGNVHAVFVTQSNSNSPNPPASTAQQAKTSQPTLWRVHAPRMTYSDLNLQAHLEGGFTADSQQLAIAGGTGDLYFTRSQTAAPAPGSQAASNANSSPAGANESAPGTALDHATASEHVTVRQGDRHGAGELGQYSATAGTFTLSGGHPTFTDASGNTTSGRQLTFYLADDTILVQSDENSRPQPHHRVEK
jgi:lipopolysaccharide export system protein LptA